MTGEKSPTIEFPCDYPIKVMGTASDDFKCFVIDVMKKHDPLFAADRVKTRDSKKGNYVAVTATITATGEAQLKAIFTELKTNPDVRMVL